MIEKKKGRVQDDEVPTQTQERGFRAIFGVKWDVCEDVWNLLDEHMPSQKRKPKQSPASQDAAAIEISSKLPLTHRTASVTKS